MKLRKINIPKPIGFLIMISLTFFALGYLLPYSLVLGKAGLLEPSVKESLSIYSNIFLFLIGFIIIYFANLLWKRNNKYGDNIGIFNKESTIFKNFTYPQMALGGLITFASVFLVINLLKVFKNGFFGLRVLPQQFSPVDSLLVSTFQIPFAEESMAFFTLGVLILVLTILAIKYNWSKQNFNVYKYSLAFVGMSIFGAIWHSSVYGGQDVAIITTAFFWGIKALLGLLTGFILIAVEFHATNNFFIDFQRLYSSDFLLGFMIFLIVGLSVLYYSIYKGRLFPFKGEI